MSVVVGGSFKEVQEPGGSIVARKNLFAFDSTTGALSTAFRPGINGKVYTLAPTAPACSSGGRSAGSTAPTHRGS